ncbi:MAG: ATP-binding protein [Acinetobacter sp.]|nr:ATP-binding protein [Acinetobacter sp.]
MTAIHKKKFPIGIQTFSKVRENDAYYYVDKTQKIMEMIDISKYIFLSRPRRFGKSLTLDTIAELYAGNKTLFTGLYAEQHWDWGVSYPIIRFNFAKGVEKTLAGLHNSLITQIKNNAQVLNVELQENERVAWLFNNLITATAQQYQSRVVILIDEYDKPILDNLDNDGTADYATAMQMRDGLRDFYSVIKGQDANICFAMLTGVSKFSKINLFSGLNILLDITLDDRFSSLCGYTQQELESVFAPELHDVNLAELKRWYNGYNWGGESVYNPFDILLYLNSSKKLFKDYWIETGNTTFLLDKIINEQVNIAQIKNELADHDILSSFEVGNISPIALMFQTGYLTIDHIQIRAGSEFYRLKFPNMEVQQSFNQLLLNQYLGKKVNTSPVRFNIYDALMQSNLEQVQGIIKAFFASIPHDWHRNNPIAQYEGYWASVFYALCASLGFTTITEDATSVGNIDLTLIIEKGVGMQAKNIVYIFEFKVKKSNATGTALQQIQAKQYADKYRSDDNVIYQIGVEFDAERREVVFDVA